MRLVPVVTVVKVTSGDRPGSYATRDASENEHFWPLIRDEPGFREQELTLLALDHAGREGRPDPIGVHLDSAARDTAKRVTAALGVSRTPSTTSSVSAARAASWTTPAAGAASGRLQRGD